MIDDENLTLKHLPAEPLLTMSQGYFYGDAVL